ncbi:hypothetical protein CIB84_010769 [Bambusicola thoracicus]|uniref:Uncharacterized protein n=1 Tax=Bambusicola thoracicus TaxID=9083 RepID=A0A2P4SMZ1_BAMTH|nr:hypothetical protein CIB84_010769 [Bambusicola thoracicus]
MAQSIVDQKGDDSEEASPQLAAATGSTDAEVHYAREQGGMAYRPKLCLPLPTSEPPPTADLRQVPLPVSRDEESYSEVDLFPPERHQVSTAMPGQPTVTELGRQICEAIHKLEGRLDRMLNLFPIKPAQSVRKLIKQILAVDSCMPAPPSGPLSHYTVAEWTQVTERR